MAKCSDLGWAGRAFSPAVYVGQAVITKSLEVVFATINASAFVLEKAAQRLLFRQLCHHRRRLTQTGHLCGTVAN